MTDFEDVIDAWRKPEAVARIHPTRQKSEEAYWASGEVQAEQVASLVKPGAYVIDFGAGDGRVAIPMHRAGLNVLAVDSSREMLNRLTDRQPEIATMVSDGADLAEKFPAGWDADALVCRAVLIHHSYRDAARLVTRFAEVVKPGGLLIVDWPVSDRPAERNTWIDVTTWDRSIRLKVAEMAGWDWVEGAFLGVDAETEGNPSVWVRQRDDVL